MRCSKCGTENPAGKKFCGGCGGSLSIRCPKCGAENTVSFKFCGDCGASLSDNAPFARGGLCFAEGFDTADLKEAKALLEELVV
jgi:double zinc ribbon protein